MVAVTLDLRCSICDQSRFYVPTHLDGDNRIVCANCTAYKCYTHELEQVLLDANRRDVTQRLSA